VGFKVLNRFLFKYFLTNEWNKTYIKKSIKKEDTYGNVPEDIFDKIVKAIKNMPNLEELELFIPLDAKYLNKILSNSPRIKISHL
jgi:hypothetical protein